MNRVAFARGLCAASLSLGVCAPAHALTARVWVSGHGVDAPTCATPTNPCRTFQYVLSNIVTPGGEIDVLDPAGYGPMVITQAVSVVNNSGPAVVQASGGDAIAISASSGSILLKGLEVTGLGTANNGLHFVGGGKLTIESCSFRHFVGDGVLIAAGGALTLHIVDFAASENGQNGVEVATGGGAVTGRIDNGSMDSNGANGLSVTGNNADMLVSGDGFSGNVTGVASSGSGSSRVALSRNAVIGNGTGVASTGGTSMFTYSSNAITGNTTNVFGLLSPLPGQ